MARRMTDGIELTRMIRAGQGAEPADLVIRDVRLLDVVTGAVVETDIAIVADRIVGTHGRYEGRREIDGGGPLLRCRASSTRISACRIVAGDAARIRPLRAAAWRDDGDLRPARDRQCAGGGGHPLFPRLRRADGDGPPHQSRPASRRRPSRPPAPRFTATTSWPFADHPKVIGLAEVDEFPRRAGQRPSPDDLAKLVAFSRAAISTAMRRCCVAWR